MSFWGVEIKPDEPYTLNFDEGVVFMLTQATLGVGSSLKKSTLQVKVGDNDPIFLCTLLPEKLESFLLNLEFDEDEDVTFSVVGPTSIHLSGILQEPQDNEEDYSDAFGEDIEGTDSEDNEYGSEDESDDDSMDMFDEDGIPMISPSPARKSGVVIEEIEDEEKPASEKGGNKQAKKKKESSSDGKPQQKAGVKGKTDAKELESEDEDGFPASQSKADKEKTKKKKNDVKDDGKSNGSLKRKVDAIDEDKEPKSDEGNKKKNKKNKKKAEIEKDETVTNASKKAAEVASPKQGKEEKKTPKPVKETKQPKKQPTVRSFPNGLIIEELEMGKPTGRKASSGKKVSVRYIGKLKKNGNIFDSNLTGKPFKFKLGAGHVIKGWDIGVEGMQVGGKRQLTIPPSLGYGASGAPPKIPQNAWLVFDVTLVDVA